MFVFGTQYLRGASPERDQWENDLKNIKKCGFNTIRAWFVWNALEREEGKIDYEYISTFLNLATKYNLKVGILFHMHACPEWAVKKYSHCFYEDEKQIPEFEYIEESLYDGTHDKLHDDGLLKYHKAGKPKRLAIKWHFKKSEYTTYFWFEDERICSIFERFYGAHPDTNTDFIIRIDAEKKKYELALFRQGLKEPQIIPEDAYQLLVFKNKFEDYRSDNYNQDRGAWIW